MLSVAYWRCMWTCISMSHVQYGRSGYTTPKMSPFPHKALKLVPGNKENYLKLKFLKKVGNRKFYYLSCILLCFAVCVMCTVYMQVYTQVHKHMSAQRSRKVQRATDAPISIPHSAQVTNTHSYVGLFMWLMWIWTQTLMSSKQVLLTTEPSSPSPLLVIWRL